VRGRSCIDANLVFAAVAGVIALVSTAGSVQAQAPIPDAQPLPGVRLGPLGLDPVVRLSEFGYDSNVLNLTEDLRPVGDFVAKLSPSVDATLRASHFRTGVHSQFDFYYYRRLPNLRDNDNLNSAQLDLLLSRLTLFLTGRHESTRNRQDFEIDSRVRRRTDDVTVGARVQLTGKTSVDAFVTRAGLKYDTDAVFLGSNLAQVLNHDDSSESISVRYAVTNLTKVAVETVRNRAQFEDEPDRESEEWRITPSVEFSPFALVSGRAAFGIYKRKYDTGGPAITGTSVLVDLSYTLLGRTRFTIGATRKPEYSYLPGLRNYVLGSLNGSVTQRLGDSWDVAGRLGRTTVRYDQGTAPGDAVVPLTPNESVVTFGADLGYSVRHTRIGAYLQHDQRYAQLLVQPREYRRLRIGSSVTYVF